MKANALLTKKLLPEAMEYLKKHIRFQVAGTDNYPTKKEIISGIKDKQGLVSLLVDQIDKEVIDAAPDLKIIANCAVGYNNIDVSYAASKGITVTNTPGVLTDTTADLAWALILSVARKIPQADRFTRQKKYKNWELDLFLGKDLKGKHPPDEKTGYPGERIPRSCSRRKSTGRSSGKGKPLGSGFRRLRERA